MKELQTYNAGDGDVVTVIWLNADHQPVAPNKATSARMTFSNGESAVFQVDRPKVRTAARRETRLHKVADSLAPRLEVAVRLAFALGRRAIGRGRDADKAVKAIRASLFDTLPKVLRKVYAAGGEVAAGMLRTAEFDPDQPRDEKGQWTAIGFHGSPRTDISELDPTERHDIRLKGDSSVLGTFISPTVLATKHYAGSKGRIYSVEVKGKLTEITEEEFQKQGSRADFRRLREKLREEGYVGARIPHLDEVVVWEKSAMRIRNASERLRTAKRGDERPKPKRIGPLAFTFDAASEEAIAWADRHAAELIDGISETSRQAISDAVAEALEHGTDPYEEILEAVGSEERARLIAHHEVMIAVHEGQREAWRQAVDEGLLTGTELSTWIVTGDDKVCPICEALDGKTRKLDGRYETEDGEFDGPPAHPRCRCTEGLS